MHKERILDLADFIENEVTDEQFHMEEWACSTAACIGGWCEARQMGVKPGDFLDELDFRAVPETAMSYLGLNLEQENDLFFPHFNVANYQAVKGEPGYISRTRAVATLRRLAETGEVAW